MKQGLAALDIECVKECAHRGPSALEEEQEVLLENGRFC